MEVGWLDGHLAVDGRNGHVAVALRYNQVGGSCFDSLVGSLQFYGHHHCHDAQGGQGHLHLPVLVHLTGIDLLHHHIVCSSVGLGDTLCLHSGQLYAVVYLAGRIVEHHHHQGVTGGIDGCQGLVRKGRYHGVALPDETCYLLAHVVVGNTCHTVLVGKAAACQAPLVVVLLHKLPVHPCRGQDVVHVVEELLAQVQVAAQTAASCAYLTHPYGLACVACQRAHLAA